MARFTDRVYLHLQFSQCAMPRKYFVMSQFIRLSRNPHKQLLWLWIGKLMKESSGYQRGVDLACGELKTFKSFKTKDYIGVDADESRVSYAKEKYGVPVIVSLLEELPDTVKGDFVLCLQTIGFNKYFDIRHAVDVVRRCVGATLPKGLLAFNAANLDQAQMNEIERLLNAGFERVEKRSYAITDSSVPKALSLITATIWRMVPGLALRKDSPAWLFICRNRRG